MNKLCFIFCILTICFLPVLIGCKPEYVTTTVVMTTTPQAQTITSIKTVTAIPQTSTITETITITKISSPATSTTLTTSTSHSSITETKTILSNVKKEIQYVGSANWDFVVNNITVKATSKSIFVSFDVNSMYQKSAFVKVEFYDINETMIGISSVVEVRIIQAGSVISSEVQFIIDDPSAVAKCIIVVSEEE
jgi:hypothetical protein